MRSWPCATLGGVVFWLAPRLWLTHWRWVAAPALLALLVGLWSGWPALSLLSSAQKFQPSAELGRGLERAVSWLGFGAAAGFVALAVRRCAGERDRMAWACAGGMLLLCAACAAVPHQFSSRYVATALPLLVLWLGDPIDTGPWGILRALTGMLVGFASLHSYYLFA